MKNTNITRTINTATATIRYVDLQSMTVEAIDISIVTAQKLSEKDFVNFYNDGSLYKQIKVDNIRYESTEVGNGRVTL